MTFDREAGTPPAPSLSIDAERLLDRIRQFGRVGRGEDGSLTRLAASDADKAARDVLADWIVRAGLELAIDRIGNLFGIWRAREHARHWRR